MIPYEPYPFSMRDFYWIGQNMSFREYVTAITSKRHKPKTVKKNKKRR
jgi:hypothetical protein